MLKESFKQPHPQCSIIMPTPHPMTSQWYNKIWRPRLKRRCVMQNGSSAAGSAAAVESLAAAAAVCAADAFTAVACAAGSASSGPGLLLILRMHLQLLFLLPLLLSLVLPWLVLLLLAPFAVIARPYVLRQTRRRQRFSLRRPLPHYHTKYMH